MRCPGNPNRWMYTHEDRRGPLHALATIDDTRSFQPTFVSDEEDEEFDWEPSTPHVAVEIYSGQRRVPQPGPYSQPNGTYIVQGLDQDEYPTPNRQPQFPEDYERLPSYHNDSHDPWPSPSMERSTPGFYVHEAEGRLVIEALMGHDPVIMVREATQDEPVDASKARADKRKKRLEADFDKKKDRMYSNAFSKGNKNKPRRGHRKNRTKRDLNGPKWKK